MSNFGKRCFLTKWNMRKSDAEKHLYQQRQDMMQVINGKWGSLITFLCWYQYHMIWTCPQYCQVSEKQLTGQQKRVWTRNSCQHLLNCCEFARKSAPMFIHCLSCCSLRHFIKKLGTFLQEVQSKCCIFCTCHLFRKFKDNSACCYGYGYCYWFIVACEVLDRR